MLEHLGKSGADILFVQREQEVGVDQNIKRIAENTNLILQTIEVDTCLAANRRINHGQQSCRDI